MVPARSLVAPASLARHRPRADARRPLAPHLFSLCLRLTTHAPTERPPPSVSIHPTGSRLLLVILDPSSWRTPSSPASLAPSCAPRASFPLPASAAIAREDTRRRSQLDVRIGPAPRIAPTLWSSRWTVAGLWRALAVHRSSALSYPTWPPRTRDTPVGRRRPCSSSGPLFFLSLSVPSPRPRC